jgi:hypothetical protein
MEKPIDEEANNVEATGSTSPLLEQATSPFCAYTSGAPTIDQALRDDDSDASPY